MWTAAVVTALGILWVKVVKPIVTAARQASDVLDTLIEIAHEFKPNHGNSLRDVIGRIEEQVLLVSGMAEEGFALNTRQHSEVSARLARVEKLLPPPEEHPPEAPPS